MRNWEAPGSPLLIAALVRRDAHFGISGRQTTGGRMSHPYLLVRRCVLAAAARPGNRPPAGTLRRAEKWPPGRRPEKTGPRK